MNHNPATDIHSYARPTEAVVQHIDLDLAVDFAEKALSGKATLIIRNISGGEKLWLDSKGLRIERITLGTDDKPTTFDRGTADAIMGESICVKIENTTAQVNVYYRTATDSEALQWLEPSQTAGKKHPFLFTQGEAILTRSWIPCQDSPGIRCTYSATITTPVGLMAVMSAENPTTAAADGKYRFEMKQAVPAYLISLAVGDLVFKSLGNKTGVYAEPAMIEKSAYEFAETEKMLTAAENLYGKYQWGRYDLLVLPPSFPFGGMENPRLTFATPTILAGDRSLTSLVAHELAHSWSGNLVTNETWNDFWLNEGFTVYFERRIMEALYGPSYSDMLSVLGREDLNEDLKALGENSKATCLKLDLRGQNPDDGMNQIAYEKGAFFLTAAEQLVGRPKFDAFLKHYFEEHAFSTMNTERFLKELNQDLLSNDPRLVSKLMADKWVYSPGLPVNMPQVHSARFDEVRKFLAVWETNTGKEGAARTKDWSSHEWLFFLRNLPKPLTRERMAKLDKEYSFTQSGNSEILFEWFQHAIMNEYKVAYPAMEEFMVRTGRRKFILPLYKSLIGTDEGKHLARMIYKKARPNYHFVATHSIDPLLGFNAGEEAAAQ